MPKPTSGNSRFGIDIGAAVRAAALRATPNVEPPAPQFAEPPPDIVPPVVPPQQAHPVAPRHDPRNDRDAFAPGNGEERRHERPLDWEPPAGRLASRAETQAALMAAAAGNRALQEAMVRLARRAGGTVISDAERARDRAAIAAWAGAADDNLPVPAAGHPDHANANLPARLGHDVAAHIGYQPNWHLCRHLPGMNADQELRTIIRRSFAQATPQQVEGISMICDLLNSPEEVRAVATWVARNARRCDEIELDYDQSFPDFKATFLVYKDARSTYMVTRDVGGHYVYIARGGLDQAPAVEHNRPARRVAVTGPEPA